MRFFTKILLKIAQNYPVQNLALRLRLMKMDKQLSKRKHTNHPPILLLSHEFAATGAAILLLKIGQQIAHAGYPVIFLCSGNTAPNLFISELLSCASGIFYYQANKKISDTLLAHLARRGVSRCISNTVVTGAFAPLLAKHSIKSVYLIHEMWASCMILNAQGAINAICGHADHVVFPASIVEDSFVRLANQPIKGEVHILPQGYYKKTDLKLSRQEAREQLLQKLNLPDNVFLLVGSGTLTFGKGFDLLLLIVTQMITLEAQTNRSTHVLWLGEPKGTPYEYWLDVQIRLMGLENRVHKIGFIADEEAYLACLQGSDAFAMVSREDSFPSVLLEALYAGLPIVAFSGSGGGAQWVQDEAGFAVPFADIEAFCRQLIWIQAHPDEAYASADKLRPMLMKKFSFPTYVHQLLSYIDIGDDLAKT